MLDLFTDELWCQTDGTDSFNSMIQLAIITPLTHGTAIIAIKSALNVDQVWMTESIAIEIEGVFIAFSNQLHGWMGRSIATPLELTPYIQLKKSATYELELRVRLKRG